MVLLLDLVQGQLKCCANPLDTLIFKKVNVIYPDQYAMAFAGGIISHPIHFKLQLLH